MLLATDIGNTNITVGLFQGKELRTTFRLTTKTPRTADEYGVLLWQLLSSQGLKPSEVDAAIVSSVVPNVMHAYMNALRRTFGVEPLSVGADMETGIRIAIANPKEVGPDRIVDAVAAYTLYGGPVLVLDFGTATTFDLVDGNGDFVAGITAPGLAISANALWKDTAKLPEVEIAKPDSILAKDTISSMQAGLVYGAIGQTKYIIEQVKKESGFPDLFVAATGGLGRLISENVPEINVYEPRLILTGLRIIYEKNTGSVGETSKNTGAVGETSKNTGAVGEAL